MQAAIDHGLWTTFLRMNFVAHFGIKPVSTIWSMRSSPLRVMLLNSITCSPFMDEILLVHPFAKPDYSRRFVPLRIWWSIPDILTVVTVPHTAPILSLQIPRAGLQFKQHYARLHSPTKVRTRSWPEGKFNRFFSSTTNSSRLHGCARPFRVTDF